METLDVYSSHGVDQLIERIDDCLASLDGDLTDDYDKLFERAQQSPCTDPVIGSYVEVYGIDRISAWQALTPENFDDLAPFFLMKSDVPIIRQVPDHLDRCRRCLAISYDYALFVEQHLPLVMEVASDCLNAYLRVEPLPPQECMDRYEDMMRTAYNYLISVPRMEYRNENLDDLASVPCENPRLTRFFRNDGIINYCELLLLSDYELERRRSRVRRLPRERRAQRLHDLSEHLAVCLRCSAQYDYEKQEAQYQDFVFQNL